MRKNWAALALTGMLCLTTFAGTQTVSAETADSAKQVDIVFTHDTHSHLNTFTTVVVKQMLLLAAPITATMHTS